MFSRSLCLHLPKIPISSCFNFAFSAFCLPAVSLLQKTYFYCKEQQEPLSWYVHQHMIFLDIGIQVGEPGDGIGQHSEEPVPDNYTKQ